jgi:CBS-domain-containing membrane protein
MTRHVVTVPPQAPVAEVARVLHAAGVAAVPVVDPSGRLLGMVSEIDVLRCQVRTSGPCPTPDPCRRTPRS